MFVATIPEMDREHINIFVAVAYIGMISTTVISDTKCIFSVITEAEEKAKTRVDSSIVKTQRERVANHSDASSAARTHTWLKSVAMGETVGTPCNSSIMS